ncbi:hypothetical protein AB7849_09370 [Rhodanobacter sp. 115]|uniref:hypothetical protein n=1 Tax=Rhodanobacter sp. FW021-MT20 TaxID=1162282 RepID=UPI0034E5A12D
MTTKNHHHSGPSLSFVEWAHLALRLDEIHESKLATHARLGYLPDRLFPMFGGVTPADRRAAVRLYYKARQYLVPLVIGSVLLIAAAVGALTGGDYVVAAFKTGAMLATFGGLAFAGLSMPFFALYRTHRDIYGGTSKAAKARYAAALAEYRVRASKGSL